MSKRSVSWMRMKHRMLIGKLPEHRQSQEPEISKETKVSRVITTDPEKSKSEKLSR